MHILTLSAFNTLSLSYSLIFPTLSFILFLSIVLSCSNSIVESTSRPFSSLLFSNTCVGRDGFSLEVRIATIVVGLYLLHRTNSSLFRSYNWSQICVIDFSSFHVVVTSPFLVCKSYAFIFVSPFDSSYYTLFRLYCQGYILKNIFIFLRLCVKVYNVKEINI